MAALTIQVIQDTVKGTIEFKTLCGAEIKDSKVLDSCFEVCWNPANDENIFEVSAGQETIVIHYREVNKTTYPTQESYYEYLKSLATCDSVSTPVVAIKDGEYTVFCDPNDNDRFVALVADLTDPLVPAFNYFYMDDGTPYGGSVNALVPCSPSQITETLICAEGVSLKQRTYIDGLGNSTYLYFGDDGAVVTAPTSYTQGACGIVTLNVDGLVATHGPKQAITTGNVAQIISVSEPKRESLVIQVYDFDVWIRFLDAATTPTLRSYYFVKAGGEFYLSAFANGQKYTGAISIINDVDGQIPLFSFTELRRP